MYNSEVQKITSQVHIAANRSARLRYVSQMHTGEAANGSAKFDAHNQNAPCAASSACTAHVNPDSSITRGPRQVDWNAFNRFCPLAAKGSASRVESQHPNVANGLATHNARKLYIDKGLA